MANSTLVVHLYNPWSHNFAHRRWNADQIQELLDYAESRFRAILNVICATTECTRKKLCKYFFVELRYVLAVVGVALLLGYDIRVHIIVRSLAAEHLSVATSSGYDINLGTDFISLITGGAHDNVTTGLVSSYYSDWWTRDALPEVTDHIPSQMQRHLLGLDIVDQCLEIHRTQRTQVTPPGGDPRIFTNRYTWGSSSGTILEPSNSDECSKCLAYRAVASTAVTDLTALGTHIHGMESIFNSRWTLSLRRASAFHEIFIAAVRKEETTPLTVSASSNIRDGDPEILQAALYSAAVRSAPLRTNRTPTAHAPNIALASEEVRRASARETIWLRKFPNVQWNYGATLSVDDVVALFKPGQHSGRVHSGYEVSLADGNLHPDSDTMSFVADDFQQKDHLSHQTVPSLPPNKFPAHFKWPPLGHGIFIAGDEAPITVLMARSVPPLSPVPLFDLSDTDSPHPAPPSPVAFDLSDDVHPQPSSPLAFDLSDDEIVDTQALQSPMGFCLSENETTLGTLAPRSNGFGHLPAPPSPLPIDLTDDEPIHAAGPYSPRPLDLSEDEAAHIPTHGSPMPFDISTPPSPLPIHLSDDEPVNNTGPSSPTPLDLSDNEAAHGSPLGLDLSAPASPALIDLSDVGQGNAPGFDSPTPLDLSEDEAANESAHGSPIPFELSAPASPAPIDLSDVNRGLALGPPSPIPLNLSEDEAAPLPTHGSPLTLDLSAPASPAPMDLSPLDLGFSPRPSNDILFDVSEDNAAPVSVQASPSVVDLSDNEEAIPLPTNPLAILMPDLEQGPSSEISTPAPFDLSEIRDSAWTTSVSPTSIGLPDGSMTEVAEPSNTASNDNINTTYGPPAGNFTEEVNNLPDALFESSEDEDYSSEEESDDFDMGDVEHDFQFEDEVQNGNGD
ncbi:hypothetical protein BDN70DRAFT_939006 [Pholiota conissans]|uniref:Uncharacterized protein n=1 Tax=Pholiota conissans TaxID=109636 RepID=A0A9P5YM53_9AGAR|nr:hypothetical protein BDN70DRAFT_939006 [Pholiota conissans]